MIAWSVGRPTTEQLGQLAALRFQQVVDDGHASVEDRTTFAATVTRWAAEHEHSHPCRVAVDQHGSVIGFGFVAVSSRPPAPHRPSRCSGDIQTFYVVPEHRNAGVGTALLEALMEDARARGVEHLTVHSSPRAASLYQRAGFGVDPLLLYRASDPAGHE